MNWLIAVTAGFLLVATCWFAAAKRKAKKARLEKAIHCDEVAAFEDLIRDVKEYEKKHPEMPTLLMRAARCNAIGVVSYLLQQGVDVNVRDAEGRTALMYAAQYNGGHNHWAVISAFLAAGADINASDCKGRTMLMFAAAHGHDPETLIQILLGRGANAKARDKYGFSAGMYWYHYRHSVRREDVTLNDYAKRVREIFLAAGDDPNKRLDLDGFTIREAITTIGGIVFV